MTSCSYSGSDIAVALLGRVPSDLRAWLGEVVEAPARLGRGRARVNVLEALDDPALFAPAFPGDSWEAWQVFLVALFGLAMDRTHRHTFRPERDWADTARSLRHAGCAARGSRKRSHCQVDQTLPARRPISLRKPVTPTLMASGGPERLIHFLCSSS